MYPSNRGSTVCMFFVLLAASGCGRSATAPAQANPSSSAASAATSCPLGVAGASIDVADSPGGADVTVTGSPERLAEIRKRAQDAASLYGAGAHRGLGHDGKHLGAQRHGLRLADLPPLDAAEEDIEGGARVHLVAKLDTQVEQLRREIRQRVDVVRASPCD